MLAEKFSLLFALMQVPSPSAAVGDKAFEACKTFGQSMLECSNILHPDQRVRVPIDLLLYPHMVLIGFRKSDNDPPAWHCGGSLISESWILTAAHCVKDPDSGPASVLRVGTATYEFDEFEGIEDLQQDRRISKIITHPEYNPPSKYHDIALFKAEPHFILSRDIRIACLQLEDDNIKNIKLTAIGFGTVNSEHSVASQTLMKVDVNVIDNFLCNKSMKVLIKRKLLTTGITEHQLCAGDYEKGGKDTCQGDSGGPLQVMPEKIDCVKTFPLHKVIGITSFGRDCGRKMAPGVYTKVSKYIDWIERIVWC